MNKLKLFNVSKILIRSVAMFLLSESVLSVIGCSSTVSLVVTFVRIILFVVSLLCSHAQ